MILLVPLPAVIVPLVMVQTYVAPVPQVGTDAMLPVDDVHTDIDAEIEAVGKGLINTR